MSGQGRRCLCGAPVRVARNLADFVGVCETREHVTVGEMDPRVYIYVENPGDVIATVSRCWLCGGVDPETTMKVAREYPGGPICEVYTTTVHAGCQERMSKEQP